MADQNDLVNDIVKPYEELLNAWTMARDHIEKIINEHPDLVNDIIESYEELNNNIDILSDKIKNFKDNYSIKNT